MIVGLNASQNNYAIKDDIKMLIDQMDKRFEQTQRE
jgi:hypothetical protein